MSLFILWAALMLAALAGAGYSHYRYRIRNNQYYARLFANSKSAPVLVQAPPAHESYLVPAITVMMAILLVPMSLSI